MSPGTNADYPDNSERFICLARGALEACRAMDLRPDVFHCNDWQTGLLPVYLRHLYRDAFRRQPAACSPSTTSPTRACSGTGT